MSEKSNRIIYNPITLKGFYLNDTLINLSNYKIILQNNFLYLESTPSFKLSTFNGTIYVKSKKKSSVTRAAYKEWANYSKERYILILFLNELITPRTKKNQQILNLTTFGGGCSYMNTITYLYFADTRSVAEANASFHRRVQQEMYDLSLKAGGGSVCEPFGGIDSSCLFGSDYGCVASYTVCCN